MHLQNEDGPERRTGFNGRKGPETTTQLGTADSYLITVTLFCLLTVIFVIGTVGNVYTLVVMSSSGLRKSGSMFSYVVSLALADLLYLSTIPFVLCTLVLHDWLFGELGCRLLFGLDFFSMQASIFTLACMSTERYRAVTRPLETFTRTPRRRRLHRVLPCVVWLAAFLLALPNMLMIHLKRSVRDGTPKRMCHPTWQMGAYRAYLTALFGTCVLVPGVLIGGVYARLALAYRKSQRAGVVAGGDSRKVRGSKHRLLYLILGIVLAYWACFLPFWIWQLINVYWPGGVSQHAAEYVNVTVTALAYGNSCVNPFLYTLLTENYRTYRHRQSRRHTGPDRKFQAHEREASRRSASVSSAGGSVALTETTSTVVHLRGITDACHL
ncbi:urotensin-2 receptor-like [Chanos chanos]|uniref:Urotensin-2 receptor n=1 Tax=Chanos chanos TaxID=29144 RepID=A0A6J2VSJ0_CHACN|nr:urotensin-2 receptor-like [Chanos chanos]